MENKWNEIVKHSTQKPNDNATNWEKFSRIFPSPPWKAKRRKRKGVSQLVLCGVFALIFVNGTWTNFQWAHLTGRWQDGWVSEWEWKRMHWRTANHPIRHSGIRSFIWSFTRRVIHAVKQSKVSIKTAMCQVPRLDSTRLYYYIIFDLNIFDIDICGLSRTPLDGLHLLSSSFLFRIEMREMCVNWNRCRGPKAAIDPDTDKCCSD